MTRGIHEGGEARELKRTLDCGVVLAFGLRCWGGWQEIQVCGASDGDSQSLEVKQTAGSS